MDLLVCFLCDFIHFVLHKVARLVARTLLFIMRGCHPVWPPYLCVHVSESGIFIIYIYMSICTLSAQAVVQQTDLLQPMFGCTALEEVLAYTTRTRRHMPVHLVPSGTLHGHTSRCILVDTQDRAVYA